jgi:hypothetical protein
MIKVNSLFMVWILALVTQCTVFAKTVGSWRPCNFVGSVRRWVERLPCCGAYGWLLVARTHKRTQERRRLL